MYFNAARASHKIHFSTMVLTNGSVLALVTYLWSAWALFQNVDAASVARIAISPLMRLNNGFQKSVRPSLGLATFELVNRSKENRRHHTFAAVKIRSIKFKCHLIELKKLSTNLNTCTNSSKRKIFGSTRNIFSSKPMTTLFFQCLVPNSDLQTQFSHGIRSGSSSFLLLRGGAKDIPIASTIATNPNHPLAESFVRFIQFVGKSRTRCLCLLVCSILLENFSTTLSKRAKDIGSPKLFACACSLYIICMIGFNISLAKIDVSVAYAIWSALGTLVITAAGIIFFGESLTFTKLLCLCLISIGVIGINLT